MLTEGENARLIAGRYRLDARLGRGGMGVVWRATDQLLGRSVAVKEMALDPALSPDEARLQRERTLREARAAAQVKHPHIIVVHDVVADGERPCIVMELVEGGSLADRLARTGPVDIAEAAAIGIALLGALRTAHAAGVLHRDIKPANVLLEAPGGRAVLTDFGIAQVSGATTLTATGAFVGSPEYTAPERMSAQSPAGPESDLWSLGALLCAAVSGVSPFRRDSLGGVLHAVVYDEIRPPAACGPLLPVVRGLLERDPAARLGADEAEEMLRALATSAGGHAPTRRSVPEVPDARTTPSRTAPSPTTPSRTTPFRTPPQTRTEPTGAPPARTEPSGTGLSRTEPSGTEPAPTEPAPTARPVAQTAPVTAQPAGAGASARRRPGAALIAGLLVAAVVGAGASAAALLMNQDDPADRADRPAATSSPTGGAPAAPSAAPPGAQVSAPAPVPSAPGERTGPSSDGKAAPAGFRVVQDPAGFALAVPHGFTRRADGPRIFYMSPDETFRIGIKVSAAEPGGPLAVHQRSHAKGPANNPGYRDAEVSSSTHNGRDAALWLFTWNGFSAAEGPRHTRDLCWEEDGRLYDVWVSAPVGRTAESREHFDTAVRTFTRAAG
ncbi:serine/threonine-protein kinase [Streptomyces yangpuensis]|uniref:serine/threonine-protein kinase n=1 Tax=Streptomyces yangpuensis TaxID=1648182 RepID=UPI000629679A|nr:serine/threonine-protein kinase [Streptomyces yangpuensis]